MTSVRGTRRGVRPAVAAMLVALAMTLAAAGSAGAATGDLLRQITADTQTSCNPDVGVAFDGTDLFVTCVFSNVVDEVRTTDGSLVRRVTVAGARNLGAAAYDRNQRQALVCNGSFLGNANDLFEARLVDLSTGTSQRLFFTRGCPFALAADASDRTVYASRSGSCTIDHYSLNGTLLSSHDVCALGAPDPSGLAVGTTQLFVGSFAGGVYAVRKDFSGASLLFPTSFGVAALACDDVTFAPKTALWVGTGIDRTLRAIEIPAGSCPFGGGPGVPTSKAQCKNDGWEIFGVFKSQGDCVSYVATGGRNSPAAARP